MRGAGRLIFAALAALLLHLLLFSLHFPFGPKPEKKTSLPDVWLQRSSMQPPSAPPAVPAGGSARTTPAPATNKSVSHSPPLQPLPTGQVSSQASVTEGSGTTISAPSSTGAASHGKTVEVVSRSPVCRRDPKPELPAVSRSLGEEGQVRLRLLIGVDGAVRSLKMVQSSGYGRLDEAARKTLLQWRCQPALRQGEPVEAEQEEAVVFKLQ